MLKKCLSLFIFAAFLVGSWLMIPVGEAHHLDANPCFLIDGRGKTVLIGGVANSGVMGFQSANHDQAACVRNVGGNLRVEGWAWNENLGWVSLYCNGGFNLGAPCGAVNYGVTIDKTGKFGGYAWGDNVGWIQFDNGVNSQVRVEVADPSCQGYIYGFTPPDFKVCKHGVNLNDGKKWTYAWSDSLGWMDFDGIHFPLFAVLQMDPTTADIVDTDMDPLIITDPANHHGIKVYFDPDPATLSKAGPQVPPVAGNGGAYKLNVVVVDKNNKPLDQNRYLVTLKPNWSKDSVKKDQTNVALQLDNVACADQNVGAVSKNCIGTFPYDVVTGTYTDTITSLAPTSNMNAADLGGGKTFSYENFISGPKPKPVLQSNDLQFETMGISIFDKDNNSCLYPNPADPLCTPKNLAPIGGAAINLKFVPATEVKVLKQASGPDNFIDLGVGAAKKFTVQVTGVGSVTLNAGIDATPKPKGANFVFDKNNDGIVEFQNANDPSAWVPFANELAEFKAGIAVDPNQQVPQYVPGLYVYSVIDQGGGVKYYSNKLPRVSGSVGVQPVAILRGSIYSNAASTSTSTIKEPLRSMGDVSSNLVRDTIFKNVAKIIAGATPQPQPGVVYLKGNMQGGNMQGLAVDSVKPNTGTMTELLKMPSGGAKVYYFRNAEVHVGSPDGSDVGWQGERTIIVMGGSVHIDANLYNAGNSKSRLGIIVLNDLANGQNNPQDGHVYIHPNVTNIKGVNIYADRAVFPKGAGINIYDPVTGEPATVDGAPFGLDAQRTLLQTHQLSIQGTVASQNCIGCANHAGTPADPLFLGNGAVLNGGDPDQNRARAQLYDLNYWRQYTGVIRRDVDGNALDKNGQPIDPAKAFLTKPTGEPWSAYDNCIAGKCGYLFPPNDLNLPDYANFQSAKGLNSQLDLGSTYIYADPPTPTLPGFAVDPNLIRNQLNH